MSSQLDRIESMLRALCTHLGVQSIDRSGNGAQATVDGDDGHRYTGMVSRFEHGWGFIECESMNRNFFVHYSDIEGTGMRSLEPGEVVSFDLAPGKDGRPKAVRVRRQASGRPAPRPIRAQGFVRSDSGEGIPVEEPEAGEGAPEEGAVPGPEETPEGEP
ncbi:MAG TPA: cold shock domain-containing protein [bacterium]|jgi:cold shock protein|nr:cold shock domain-containing protein [bacterium]